MPEGKSLDTLWEIPDGLWEEIAPLIADLDPPKATGRKRQNLSADVQRNHLPAALGLPVEPSAPRTGRRQHHPPDFPAVGAGWVVPLELGTHSGPLRRTGRGGLGMAVGRRGNGQGPFGGMPPAGTPPTGESRGPSAASW